MNTSKSLDSIFDPVTMDELEIPKWWVDKTKAAIVEAVGGLYGDSDGLREFASTGTNQVVNPNVNKRGYVGIGIYGSKWESNVGTLMLEVMRLRNTYKYDAVAPQAMNNEMDVAYHKAKQAIQTLIAQETNKAAIQELIIVKTNPYAINNLELRKWIDERIEGLTADKEPGLV